MAALLAMLGAFASWLLCVLGIILAVFLALLLIVLFVPAFVQIEYEDGALTVVVGLLFVRVHVYPYFYFLWDKYENETEEEQAERLAKKEIKRARKETKRAEHKAKKIEPAVAAKGAKITLEMIVALLRAAGMATKLVVNALRIEKICLWLPIHKEDPAQTAIFYGKVNAWLYSSLAVLNHFLYLDFQELQITPVFEEKFERSAYFSCKVSARLFIMVVVAVRLLQMLWHEKELLSLFQKKKPMHATK